MSAPLFTVIVPTFERPRQLERCLNGLAAQTFSKSDYEVVVVDDAAKAEVVAPLIRNFHAVTCRLLSQDHLGAAAARNAGARVAKGQLLAFTDDDCRPDPDWLSCLARHMGRSDSVALVGGKVVNELKRDHFASATQALVDYLYDYFNRDPECARMLASNNFCVPAAAFADIGGFDTAFSGAGGEDREFCLRWAHAGYRLVYAPEATVLHAHEMTLAKFIRQHFAYGRGAAMLRRRARDHGYGPVALESAAFYWDLLRYPLQAPGIDRRAICSALFMLSQLANTLGYFRIRMTKQ